MIQVYRIESSTFSGTITHLHCNAIPTTPTSPVAILSPVPAMPNSQTVEEYKNVAVDPVAAEKPSYSSNQTQSHVKMENIPSEYQSHYHMPPIVFVPGSATSHSNLTPPTGANNNATTSTSYSNPQHQNVGTILAENTAMLQNVPVPAVASYSTVHTHTPANQMSNNFYPPHSQTQPDTCNNTLQYGGAPNPIR